MKHFLALFLLVFLTASLRSVAQGSLAALDEKNGFRDAKLGAPFTQFKGMVRTYKRGNITSYKRPIDKMMLGDIPLSIIEYTFYKGKLESVRINFKREYLDKVIETLKTAYGNGGKDSRKPYFYNIWETKKVSLDVMSGTIGLSPGLYLPSINFSSVEISHRREHDELHEAIDWYNSNTSKRQSDL